MQLAIQLLALLMVLSPETGAVEVVSQQIELGSEAQVWPTNGPGAHDQATRSNLGIGDRVLETSTATSFQEVNVYATSMLEVRRTNTATEMMFEIESRLGMRSEDFISLVSTQMTTRATARAMVMLQVRSERPVRYEVRKAGFFSLPGAGSVIISGMNGTVLLQQGWISGTTEPAESTGVLPKGTYTIVYSENAYGDGTVSPAFVNHMGGESETDVTITLSAAEVEPFPAPGLYLRRDSIDRLVLELSNLWPGAFYTIERSNGLQPDAWSFVVNFVAVGTEASWTDTLNVHTATTFYRVRY
jgi:hypothetical protein